ncbi:MAG: ATP-binding protein [Nanoarchaeota archaeon]|nr:ATP-binding protein [Nanoarchaeota archaeon]
MFPTTSRKEFFIIKPSENPVDIVQLRGEKFREIYELIRKIVKHQFQKQISNGIRGFLLHGEVGTGKTTMVKALARDISSDLYFVDGADIARGLYGQSEERISDLFNEANKKSKSIILIDDAESVFPTRDWQKGQSWHVAQNNVFFHKLDDVNSAKTIVILTTNRYDLIDKAIKDRLCSLEIPQPDTQTLIDIASSKCFELGMQSDRITKIISQNPKDYTSIRAVEKLVMQEYIKSI